MTLYEIDQKIEAAIMNAVNEETGEITEDFALLDELQLEREQKIENGGLYIKNLTAEIESLKAEEKALCERRKSKEKRAEWLKGYLTYSLDGAKFETPKLALSFRKSVVVDVADVDKLPEEFKRVKTTVDADKTALKEALKAGALIDGATLVEKQNLQIK